MTTTKKSFFLSSMILSVVIFLFPLSASASGGLLEEPNVNDYCIQIINTQEYPDHTFLLTVFHPYPTAGHDIIKINNGSCIQVDFHNGGIYHHHGKLYAIKNEDYNRIGKNLKEADFESADNNKNNELISSDLEIVAYVKDVNKVYNKIISVVKIISIENDGFLILEYKNNHIKNDGSVEKVFEKDNRDQSKSLSIISLFCASLFFLFLFVYFIVLAIRYSRRKSSMIFFDKVMFYVLLIIYIILIISILSISL